MSEAQPDAAQPSGTPTVHPEALRVQSLFAPLYSDLKPENEFYNRKPLLAHYTSMAVLEQIIKNNEIWFSKPLFMNDLDEVTFGFRRGAQTFRDNDAIRLALKNAKRHETFVLALDHYINTFADKHLLDSVLHVRASER